METTENNKLIAEFLGEEYKDGCIVLPYKHFCGVNPSGKVWGETKYHKDWNWLISAIGKLNEEMKSSLFKTDVFSKISSMILVNDINGAYQYFVEALNYHNQQSK